MTSVTELVAIVNAQTDRRWAFQLLCDGLEELVADARARQAAAVGSPVCTVRAGEEPAPGADVAVPEGKADDDGVQGI